jgi:hypothetical protein
MIYTGEGSAVDAYFKKDSTDGLSTDGLQPVSTTNFGRFNSNNQQHRIIMSILYQAGITTQNQRHGTVADMTGWFSAFLQSSRCPVNKPLLEMTPKEVSKIITALEGVALWKATINYQ